MNQDIIINNIFFPRKFYSVDDKDHKIKISSQVSLNTRIFVNNKNNPNILYFHGNGEIAQDYNYIAKIYNSFNLNLIVAEYRGYGLSNGTPSKDNLHNDSLIVFDGIRKYLFNNQHNNKLIIMGRSLGSSSAAHIIDNKINFIDGCIIESGFATEHFFFKLFGVDVQKINYSVNDGFENLKKFKNYTKPLLLIHSDSDDIVPYSEAKLILDTVPSTNKKLYTIKNATHNNIMLYDKDRYLKIIKSFIDSI